MADKYFDFIIHGGDYNPDQWINTPEITDEDMRLMKLAHVNSATVSIFSWSLLEPEEGKYNFEWLDTIMDKMAANGISVILATPSGARPAWLAEKYPEVLRVQENGIRNEFGVRHNHCPTSPVYREKVRNINRLLAERYKNHPALKMWHISNEYSDSCHCELCQQKFREWLSNYYHNDIEELNEQWWGGFWSHRYNNFNQISSPKMRGESHVSAQKLCWNRFVTDNTIDFYENEIAPLREITPDIPITTNLMRLHDSFDYQKFASHLDLISWDNYPDWGTGNDEYTSVETAFVHDWFRSMKGGKPFFMMESTPSIVNWKDVNKIPDPRIHALTAVQAVACGSDSVQYFQWRKARGGHEKYHGAVVDHEGSENTRVFRSVAETGKILEKLGGITGSRAKAKVAVVMDVENLWATKYYNGYNNSHRDYKQECIKWYKPFAQKGITADVIPMDADFSGYDLVIAPYLYMLKDGTGERIKNYVAGGGRFVATYLTANVNKNDLCYLGGFPGDGLREVFGVWAEETDSLPEGHKAVASYMNQNYTINHICDIIHAEGARVLGEYKSDFYAGMPSVTVNEYGKGEAYYVAFRSDGTFVSDFCNKLIEKYGIKADAPVEIEEGILMRKRGDYIFLLNFTGKVLSAKLDREYADVINGGTLSGTVTVEPMSFTVIK